MGGKSGGTVGYRYYIGMHLVVCYGPVDEVHEIRVGDRLAYDAGGADPALTSSGTIIISKPELFGGEEREGGVGATPTGGEEGLIGGIVQITNTFSRGGDVDVAFGENTQVVNPYLDGVLAGEVPAYRGVMAFIFNEFYIGNNPYVKDWQFEISRYPGVLNPATKQIGTDANPANMIFELLTNIDWGMGYNVADIDSPSFTAAAITLEGEGLGLSMILTSSDTIESFIETILEHINASLYLDLATGLFVIKLIRDDYVIAALPLYDESNIVEMQNFSRRGWGETINELTVVYHDQVTNKNVPVTVQDMANIQVQGTTINTTRQYPGISNAEQANIIALRDLQTLSSPLAKIKMKVNRDAWDIAPGDVFKVSWLAFGIVEVVFRVGAVDYGNLKDGHINIDAIEDIFGLPSAVYAAPQPSGWVEPSGPPIDATFQFVEEATYYDIVQAIGEDDAANVAMDQGFLKGFAVGPTSTHYNFRLMVSPDETLALYVQDGLGNFAASATLVAAMVTGAQTTFVYEGDTGGLPFMEINTFIQIDNEFMSVISHDVDNKTMIVDRGVVDSVPAPHLIGARLYENQDARAFSITQYTDGEQLDIKLLGSTGQGTLALVDATTIIFTLTGRKDKPYPPANLAVEGLAAYIPQGMTSGDFDVTWEHRDRTQQTTHAHPPQDFGDIGPEIGTTYTLRFYNEDNVLSKTEVLIAGTSFTWTTEIADSGLGRVNNDLRIELEAVNSVSGLTSHFFHDYAFRRADYGYSYGLFYGGFV